MSNDEAEVSLCCGILPLCLTVVPLGAIATRLGLSWPSRLAAMLFGARSLYAIAQWGRLQEPEVVRAPGFSRDKTPAVSTFHEVFKTLEEGTFEAALSEWAREELGEGKGAIAIDGEELTGVRLVAAYCDDAGLVLAQSGGRRPE